MAHEAAICATWARAPPSALFIAATSHVQNLLLYAVFALRKKRFTSPTIVYGPMRREAICRVLSPFIGAGPYFFFSFFFSDILIGFHDDDMMILLISRAAAGIQLDALHILLRFWFCFHFLIPHMMAKMLLKIYRAF